MNDGRYFLDAFFVIALLNRRDRYHEKARKWLPQLGIAYEIWTTDAVILEIADGLSAMNRVAAGDFITYLKRARNVHIVPIDTALLDRGLVLYLSRSDKTWGLTDCISFLVMSDQKLSEALTADAHFIQAGFHALLTA